MEQAIGQLTAVDHHAGQCGGAPMRFHGRGGHSDGKGGPVNANVQGCYVSVDPRVNMLTARGRPPQQQVWGEQPPVVGMAHDVSTPPFPPPVPRASPDQLLQEIRQGLSGYELSRLVAIEATQRVLSKRLSEMATIDERMGALFNERAEMQKKVSY